MESLTPQQNEVLGLIADGLTLTGAAERAGIHRNTIRNWRLTIPEFAAGLEDALEEQATVAREHALQRMPQALAVIDDILNDKTASPSVRLRAALAIMKLAATPPATGKTHPAQESPRAVQPQPRTETPVLATARPSESVQPEIVQTKIEIPAQSRTITPIRLAPEPGRNTLCPCGSGLKFKRCCSQKRIPA